MHSKVPRFLHKSKLRCRHALFNDKAGMMEHCIGLGASLQCVANPGPWGHGQERHCLADGRTEAGQRLRRTQCWLTLAPRRAEGYESSLWPEARFQLFSRSRLFRAETVEACPVETSVLLGVRIRMLNRSIIKFAPCTCTCGGSAASNMGHARESRETSPEGSSGERSPRDGPRKGLLSRSGEL